VLTAQPLAITQARFSAPAATFCCAKEAHGGEGKEFPVPGIVTNAAAVGSSSVVVKVPRGKSRPLTSGETAMARRIFKDAIDYAAVKVFNESYLPVGSLGDFSTTTPDGNLYCGSGHYEDDFSATLPSRAWRRHVFMHEMVHVWQYSMGYWVKAVGAVFQAVDWAMKSVGKTAYSYGIERTHHVDRVDLSGRVAKMWSEVPHLSSFHMEQQGELISDYFCLIDGRPDLMSPSGRSIKDVTLFNDVLAGFLSNPKSSEWLPSTGPVR
jgi:hypothetical protein